ncbi:hypothetical protein V1264_011561 [Littorina saxatilis]|uniref:Uncharacterized protein n=1 Tax=Littorina saxatilis TaxID=31220 RepID=A0AAN9BUZ5_9CAEN
MDGQEQRDKFYELYDKLIAGLAEKNRDAYSIHQERYEKILSALSLEKGERCEFGHHFKSLCIKNFKLQKIGGQHVVYRHGWPSGKASAP